MSVEINFWRLVDSDLVQAPVLEGMHNHWLCAMAMLMAILAAGVLLPVINRYHNGNQRYRGFWLCCGSMAMGTGIWAMHFTAMLAYRLPLTVSYDVLITAISIVPAVLASAHCIISYSPQDPLKRPLYQPAASLAVGIGAMHYLGMEAIIVSADMYYQPGLFLLSIVAAYLLAYLGLYIHRASNNTDVIPVNIGLLAGSVVLGVAVSGMHFIAMAATYFVANDKLTLSQLAFEPYGLIASIFLAAVFILGFLMVGVIIDRRFEQVTTSLSQSEMRFSQLADSTQMAIFTFDQERVTYANPALSKVLGYSDEQIRTMTLMQLFGEAFNHLARDVLKPPLIFDKSFHEEFKIYDREGEARWMYFSLTLTQFHDEPLGLASGFDISDQKRAEYSLRELAYHDPLTGLANRTMFIDRVDHHLKLTRRNSKLLPSCVMLLDLDGFKGVNDSLGHQAGDELLRIVASRLKNSCRESDTLARLGGDEFVIMLEGQRELQDWSMMADKLLGIIAEPFEIDGQTVEVGTSIGVLPLEEDKYDNADDVLRDVDIALYRAKHFQQSYWVIFDDKLDATARRLRTLHGELKGAVKSGELQIYYQPIVDVSIGKVIGFEALSRWQRSNGEWVSPADFIPLAERTGLISDITIWALRTVAKQLEQWQKTIADRSVYVSINVAAVSFTDERFYAELDQMLKKHLHSSRQIKLELTESMLMKNADAMLLRLDQLSAMGFELLLDDFGTGYSSLAALNRLPINTVKIDQSFVADLGDREQAASVIKTILSLASHLNMSVISEGVESPEQAQELNRLGCHLMQGYLFGRPVAATDALEQLSKEFKVS